ncbi:MAG: 5'/3'-nucleotidase SurE [Myxococcales bacterium]|nr:5'/3'-nucleotidase SurE [Myxococcales bacterium]
MSERPILLLTNDDGVQAGGLRALREALLPLGHVVVVAPTHQQSASSHSITLDRPLRHLEHATDVHSIDGTPADCIYLALFESRFLPRRPDLVVSGINHGSNLGTSVFYSGTVAGAREAALRGIHSVAFSHDGDADAPWAPPLARDMVERFLQSEKPEDRSTLLSVNMPAETPKGIKVTRVGRHIYEEDVIPRVDPGGREYFWIGGRVIDYGNVEGSDKRAVDEGYVSVTPLALEPTSADDLGMAAFVAGPRSEGPS